MAVSTLQHSSDLLQAETGAPHVGSQPTAQLGSYPVEQVFAQVFFERFGNKQLNNPFFFFGAQTGAHVVAGTHVVGATQLEATGPQTLAGAAQVAPNEAHPNDAGSNPGATQLEAKGPQTPAGAAQVAPNEAQAGAQASGPQPRFGPQVEGATQLEAKGPQTPAGAAQVAPNEAQAGGAHPLSSGAQPLTLAGTAHVAPNEAQAGVPRAGPQFDAGAQPTEDPQGEQAGAQEFPQIDGFAVAQDL